MWRWTAPVIPLSSTIDEMGLDACPPANSDDEILDGAKRIPPM
jgi:hypothetical protein